MTWEEFYSLLDQDNKIVQNAIKEVIQEPGISKSNSCYRFEISETPGDIIKIEPLDTEDISTKGVF